MVEKWREIVTLRSTLRNEEKRERGRDIIEEILDKLNKIYPAREGGIKCEGDCFRPR